MVTTVNTAGNVNVNPLIAQGTLNRLRGSVVWSGFPTLNVTAPYLSKEGIRLALDGEATVFLPTITGAVTSPEPYQMITLTMNILKSNGLAAQYQAQMQNTCLLGNGIVYTDTSALPTFPIVNCAIEGVREMSFSGEDPTFAVLIRGYYIVNNALWSLV
jgi:hypothetical protein